MIYATSKGGKTIKRTEKKFSTNGEQETLNSYFFHQLYLLIYEKYLYLLPTGKLYKYMHFTFTSEHTQEKKRKGNQHSQK